MVLHDTLSATTGRLPNKTALVYKSVRFTYADLELKVAALASALVALGIPKGARVALYLGDSPETIIGIYGILKAKKVIVPLSPNLKSKKLEYILNNCGVSCLITDSVHLPIVTESTFACPTLKTVLVAGEIPDPGENRLPVRIVSFNALVKEYRHTDQNVPCIDQDLAAIIYTSGSTGNPKGVTLQHRNMVAALFSIIEYLEIVESDIILNCLPLSFDYGLYQVLMAFATGATIILEPGFAYPSVPLALIESEKVTGFPLVPSMAAILLTFSNLATRDFTSVRYVTNTGQALPAAHSAGLKRVFNRAKIFSMYGLTECKRATYLPPAELDARPLSVGKAIPCCEVWLVDEQGNRVTTPGVCGELVVCGPNVMVGYWEKPQETDAVLKSGRVPGEKVLYSGDIFKMDAEGYLYFVNRKDDMIKSGGELVSPREVEEVLHRMPEIAEAAVVAISDPILGMALKAFIVVTPERTTSAPAVMHYCSQMLEPLKVPKRVKILPNLPKTATGKVDKRALLDSQ